MLISCDFFPKPSTNLIETWNIVNRIENRIKYLKCCSEKRYSVTAYFVSKFKCLLLIVTFPFIVVSCNVPMLCR